MSAQDPNGLLAQVLLRLDDLDARLRLLEADRPAPPPRDPVSSPIEEHSESAPPEAFPILSGPPTFEREEIVPPPTHPRLETQVGLTWLNRIGVLTVVLGVAFFFKYAVDNRLIGETGRVILGVLTAWAALGLAELFFRRDHRIYAQGITGAGIAILYLSLYSAFGFYHLLPQFVVFVLMFLTTTMAVALSVRYDSIAIAALGFTGGYLTPLLLSTNDDRPWALFTYLFILGSGGMALVSRKSWKYLEPLLLAGTALVYFLWFSSRFQPGKELVATVAALAFYALFWKFSSLTVLLAAQVLSVLAIAAIWSASEVHSLWIELLLSIAGLAAAERRLRPPLAFAAFSLFWMSAILWRMRYFPKVPWLGLAILTVALLVFLGYAGWRLIRVRESPEDSPPAPYLGMLALAGPLYFAISYTLLNPLYHAYLGLFTAALAALYLVGAWLMWQQLETFTAPSHSADQLRPVFLSVGAALTFLTLAVPIQFSQFRITMSWALEGAAFTWIAERTGNKRFGSAALIIFALAFLRLGFFEVSMFRSAVPHLLLANARLLTFVLSGICFWLGAHWMEKGRPALALYIAGHIVVLWALLLEVFDWAYRNASPADYASAGTVSASVLLAVYGIALVILGVSLRSLVNRVTGLTLLAIVVFKLYMYDVWQLQQTFRVVAFVVLGILLLTASFLYSRFRSVVEKLWDRQSD